MDGIDIRLDAVVQACNSRTLVVIPTVLEPLERTHDGVPASSPATVPVNVNIRLLKC